MKLEPKLSEYEKIKDLNLHECLVVKPGLTIRRVVGGLMYVCYDGASESTIFVPNLNFYKQDYQF